MHALLAVSVVVALACEAARIETESSTWTVLAAAVVLVALVLAWREQDELMLAPVCALALSLAIGWIAVRESLGATGDQDPLAYGAYGNELLHGTYPQSEYPAGGVVLFALEALLGGGSARVPNELLMVPFQLLCVGAVWSLRTRCSSWLATVIALWPMSAYYWQYRFDLVPAALIVLGLLLAYRGRWGWSGIALGVGAAVKWSPALSILVLAVWLASHTRWRDLERSVSGFLGALILVNAPFLAWAPARVLETYHGQGSRAITNESIWFFPFSALGLTGDDRRIWAPAGTPGWTNVVAVSAQTLLVVALLGLAASRRTTVRHAVALAALGPVAFLLVNRVFSPQFLVVISSALAFAAALVIVDRRAQLLLGLLLSAATFADAFVYPYDVPFGLTSWRPFSAATFVTALFASGYVLVRSVREGSEQTALTLDVEPEGFGEMIERGRKALTVAEPEQDDPVGAPPFWAGRALRWLTAAVAAGFATAAVFAAVVMPYRFWDSLAFGAWSRSIADGAGSWLDQPPYFLQRPLFYVAQGLLWRAAGDEEWLGRLLSLSFALILALALWALASQLASGRDACAFLPPLALGVLLSSSIFATYLAAGMSDVPVAALVTATAAAVWTERSSGWRTGIALLASAAAVLAKPSALLSFAGLVPAILVLQGRGATRKLIALLAGIALGLGYDLWQARRLDETLSGFLTAGNEAFWRARGAAARWDAVARAEWLGSGVRLLVLYGIAYGIVRALGGRTSLALGIAAATAIAWSLAGPTIADGGAGYPFNWSLVGVAVWLVVASAMILAPFVSRSDPLSRRTYVALLLWLAPTAVGWVWQRADEVRLLAPVWTPLALLAATALFSLSLALARLRPAAALVPACAVLALALANVVSIDGLGRSGWRGLIDLGPSGWSDRAAIENYAYGPFSYELDLARENVGDTERILSSNGRLAYFFPGRVDVEYPTACSQLDGTRFFSILMSGESLQFARQAGQSTDPLAWLQCSHPHVELVGEQPGIYAAFVVGRSPSRPPTAADCHITSTPGHLWDAVFGQNLNYASAKALRDHALATGFQGTTLEQTGCSTFRVLVKGIPASRSVRGGFRREAASVGLSVTYLPAVRYPEVSPDVPAVR